MDTQIRQSESTAETLYELRHVLRREQDGLKCYVCLHNLRTQKYGVQQCEYISSKHLQDDLERLPNNTFELFIEASPELRCRWFDSLHEAVDQFAKEFD